MAAVPAVFGSSARLSDRTDTVNYEAIAGDALPSILLDPTRADSIVSSFASDRPSILLVYLGKEIRTSDLSDLSDGGAAVEPLKALLADSQASRFFPYVRAQPLAHMAGTVDALLASFSSLAFAGKAAVSDGCGAVAHSEVDRFADESSLEAALKARASQRGEREMDLVLLCSTAPDTPDTDHRGAVAAETLELSSTAALIRPSADSFAFFYTALDAAADADTAAAEEEAGEGAQRRLLAAGEEAVGEGAADGLPLERAEATKGAAMGKKKSKCGPTCKTRAMLLEGIFTAILLLVILVSGLTVLSQIDTPTRFEVPRESS